MIGHVPGGSRYESLRQSQRVLERMAPLVRFGLFAVGLSVFLDHARALVSDAQFTWGERRVMGIVALVTLGGFGLAGWVAGRLIKASADLIEVFIAGAESAGRAADLIELHLVPTLGRIASALERASTSTAQGEAERARDVAVARQAIAAGRLGQAERLIEAFGRQFPGATEAGLLDEALADARQAAIDEGRARLDEARRADDPDRVIDCRDALTEHLRGEPLKDLDRQVVRWLVSRVQARAQSGTAGRGADAAALAARVAESFGDTPEGASLRAALPSLRRGAGLCPRCARPNPGRGDVCPRCASVGAAPLPLPDAPESEVIP